MEKKEKTISIIYEAIEETNQLLPKELKLEKSLDTILFGKETIIDSLSMVNLIEAIEEKIEERFDGTINLTEGLINSQENNYFENVASLAEYINNKLG